MTKKVILVLESGSVCEDYSTSASATTEQQKGRLEHLLQQVGR